MDDECEEKTEYRGIEVKCFKSKSHVNDKTSHEGIVKKDGQYDGTITWH